jgi:hypothetical protein
VLFQDILEAERADGRRIVFENETAIAFIPYFARCAYEVDVAPKATRAAELIAREAGVIAADPSGRPLQAPLDVTSNVAWVGYANESIRSQVEPLLQQALRSRGLIPAMAR